MTYSASANGRVLTVQQAATDAATVTGTLTAAILQPDAQTMRHARLRCTGANTHRVANLMQSYVIACAIGDRAQVKRYEAILQTV